jgi:phosphotransferase system enzyme I (PtsI)
LVHQFLRAGRAAPRAAWEAFGAYRDMRASDPLRPAPDAAELDDVRDRVVARLLGEPPPSIPDPGTPYVLVARDLSPALTATLDAGRVLALVTERGGPTSHTAVLAKALGIPAVVAAPGVASLATGQRVAVDGTAGTVTADPDADTVDAFRRGNAATVVKAADTGPGRTRDGRQVQLMAAVGGKGDVEEAVAAGAEGVGVFRTEFLFLDRADPRRWPSRPAPIARYSTRSPAGR